MLPWGKIRKKTGQSVLCRIGTNVELLRCLNADQQVKLFKCLLSERHPEEFYRTFLEQSRISSESQTELMRAAEYYFSLLSSGSDEAEPEL